LSELPADIFIAYIENACGEGTLASISDGGTAEPTAQL
jgi:hypothetical protein